MSSLSLCLSMCASLSGVRRLAGEGGVGESSISSYGKEMAVIGAGMKMGDKMDYMSKDGKMECTKEMMKK